MRKTYQFRIYPTRKQTIKLLHILSICRILYTTRGRPFEEIEVEAVTG